jgi:hypothetical protein
MAPSKFNAARVTQRIIYTQLESMVSRLYLNYKKKVTFVNCCNNMGITTLGTNSLAALPSRSTSTTSFRLVEKRFRNMRTGRRAGRDVLIHGMRGPAPSWFLFSNFM